MAFFTANVAAAFAAVVAAGAAPLADPKVMPWGQTVAYVGSMEDSIVGLCTPVAS